MNDTPPILTETPPQNGEAGRVLCSTDLLDVRRTHLDLFSGIGGFALAANAAGYKTIGFSEIEPYACKILKRHWPDVPNYGDIRNVRGIRCELLTGGFPCQPFSLAGKQRGAKDDRHLWPEMCRVIAEARPTWVLGENVPGIIGMELDGVLSDLEAIGYTAWTLVIPACAVDARHRRDRVWILAHRDSGGGSPESGKQQAERPPVANSSRPRDVAHADEPRSQGRNGPKLSECGTERTVGKGCSSVADAGKLEWNGRSARPCGWGGEPQEVVRNAGLRGWEEDGLSIPESLLGRVAHGIPNRAHRLKGLGNAIVPQVAEQILKTMINL